MSNAQVDSVVASVKAGAPVAFVCEADMLAPLVAQQGSYVGRHRLSPYFEVQTTRGVVDILLAEVDNDLLFDRRAKRIAPIVDASLMRVLHTFGIICGNQDGAFLNPGEIASVTGISVGHLRRKILPELEDSGWVSRAGRSAWLINEPYLPPVRRLIAVEAKRSSWRQALSQAASHVDFADLTYVALDGSRTPGGQEWHRAFTHAGVGILTVQASYAQAGAPPSTKVSRVVVASAQRPQGLARAIVAERVAALSEAGSFSGSVTHVFGRTLTTEWGVDPRLTACG